MSQSNMHFLAPTGAQGVKMYVCMGHYAKGDYKRVLELKRELKKELKREL